ncbi:MAG: hypothetical protein ACREFD_15955, partial [Stellaceae bacterium]
AKPRPMVPYMLPEQAPQQRTRAMLARFPRRIVAARRTPIPFHGGIIRGLRRQVHGNGRPSLSHRRGTAGGPAMA